MLKSVLNNVTKSVSKRQTGGSERRNGNNLPVAQNKLHSGQFRPYMRCLSGLADVINRKKIKCKGMYAVRGARHLQIALRLYDATMSHVLTKTETTEAIATAAASKNVLIRRDHGFMLVEFELAPKYWEYYDRSYVDGLGIGLATRKEQVEIGFNDDTSQCLIAGTTGSGKTIAIQSALLAMMSQYTPDDTKFILVDPHQDHGEFQNEAHLALPVAQSDQDIAKSLNYAAKLFEHRRAENIRDDYQLVVLIDEITELTDRQPELEPVIATLVNGRKFNINLIAGAHQVNKNSLPGKDKFTQRFIGKTDIGTSYHATGLKGLETHKLSGKGDFYHIAHSDVTRFQVAMPKQSDFSRLSRCDVYDNLADIEPVSSRFVHENSSTGRPPVKVEPEILADYLQYDLSVRKASSEFGYGRTTHSLHKQFAKELLSELSNRGLSICDEVNYE